MNRFLALTAAALSVACAHHVAQAGEVGKKAAKPVAQKASRAESVRVAKVPAHAAESPKKSAKASQLASARKVESIRAAEAFGELPISQAQLEIAERVLTGVADCELNQTVRVEPQPDRPGHFRVAFRNVAYTMVPEETSTGAVRLFDRRAEVMWLQIPTKSMLMDAKVGQRVVDACMQTEQRITASAPPSVHASSGLGWSTPVPVPAPVLAASLALPAAQAAVPMPPVSSLAASMPAAAQAMATLAVVAPSAPEVQAEPPSDAAVPAAASPDSSAAPRLTD